jgi:hypothetical protein
MNEFDSLVVWSPDLKEGRDAELKHQRKRARKLAQFLYGQKRTVAPSATRIALNPDRSWIGTCADVISDAVNRGYEWKSQVHVSCRHMELLDDLSHTTTEETLTRLLERLQHAAISISNTFGVMATPTWHKLEAFGSLSTQDVIKLWILYGGTVLAAVGVDTRNCISPPPLRQLRENHDERMDLVRLMGWDEVEPGPGSWVAYLPDGRLVKIRKGDENWGLERHAYGCTVKLLLIK